MAGTPTSSYPEYRFTYSGRSLLVTDLTGAVRGHRLEGFYLDNTRVLCRDHITLGGGTLAPISAAPTAPGELLAYFRSEHGGEPLPTAVNLELRRLVGEGIRSELTLQYPAPAGNLLLELHWHLAADFADVQEALQGRRQQEGPIATAWNPDARELTFRYDHPRLDRAAVIQVEASPVHPAWKDGFLAFTLELDARRPVVIRLAVTPVFDGRARPAHAQRFGDDGNPLAALCRRLRSDAPSLSSTNADVAKAWEAAVSDLASLPLGLASAPAAPMAGVPTYQQFFGRDALTIGIQSAMAFPRVLRDSLLATAETQGQVVDNWRDEEPGTILHQADGGPLATLGETPFARYYGDYSAPQDFLLGLATYLLWTGDRQLAHRLLPAVRRVVGWADRYGDGDGDGFLEYDTRSRKGLKNQGWKDSGDAIVDQHGRVVDNPIATCEVQAYWYSAQRAAALVFALTRRWRDAQRCLREAGRLRERFDRAFWMADEGFYAMALGPDKDQVRSVASNGGHALAAGIVPPERGAAVARRLLAPDLFSGWGVRTLSADHVAYDPFSYHRGSVWPVETGTFVLGLAAYGCVEELHRLTEGMFASTRLFAGSRLPEAIGGVPRDVDHPHPGIYSQANEPHGWSTSSLVLAVQALLGMRPIAPLGLLLVNPQLPPWIPDLRLNGLRVGKARLDLEFRRARRGRTQFRATVREGRLRVLRQPPALSASTTLLARVLAAASSFPRQRSTGERS